MEEEHVRGNKGTAVFSHDRGYRYSLTRDLQPLDIDRRVVTFVLLNPSVGGEDKNDATIRACMRYAQRFARNWLNIVNLNPYVSTDPGKMRQRGLPEDVVERNARYVERAVSRDKALVVVGWGAQDLQRVPGATRIIEVLQRSQVSIWCLQKTRAGMPWHPLFCPSRTVERYEL